MKAEFNVCPELDRERRSDLHEPTQECVKELIEQLKGVVVLGDTFWVINAFVARLSWAQMQTRFFRPLSSLSLWLGFAYGAPLRCLVTGHGEENRRELACECDGCDAFSAAGSDL